MRGGRALLEPRVLFRVERPVLLLQDRLPIGRVLGLRGDVVPVLRVAREQPFELFLHEPLHGGSGAVRMGPGGHVGLDQVVHRALGGVVDHPVLAVHGGDDHDVHVLRVAFDSDRVAIEAARLDHADRDLRELAREELGVADFDVGVRDAAAPDAFLGGVGASRWQLRVEEQRLRRDTEAGEGVGGEEKGEGQNGEKHGFLGRSKVQIASSILAEKLCFVKETC